MAYQDSSRVRDKLTEIEVAIQETNTHLQAGIKKTRSPRRSNSPSTNGKSNVAPIDDMAFSWLSNSNGDWVVKKFVRRNRSVPKAVERR